jgi:hypothetical protein
MPYKYPFQFPPANSVNLAATSSSSRVALSTTGEDFVRVSIPSSGVDTFVEFGDSTVVAVLGTATHIPPGDVEVFRVPLSYTHIAAITASGSSTVYAVRGDGA